MTQKGLTFLAVFSDQIESTIQIGLLKITTNIIYDALHTTKNDGGR